MFNGFHFLMALVVVYGFVVVLPRAIRLDRRDMHLLHKPGTCTECDAP
ncbi:hypothetical protein PP639_gp060 [Arthrobacter phage Seahorse]|uniref:Uncharacterized protein n=1 Tax=Arthrobacter phage Seahorse TaxID=2419611 RepID=A0A3G3M4X4_9CAUD|nr:hypothetical protein PP639_gp060 [Arthrobacter phage Seahorse]AYR01560.1 hypothetical protein PBI_SEAHORSE_60 [Arthrobacter phage Seahorse]